MDCCRGDANESQFDARIARRELARFRKRGPEASTMRLLVAIEEAALPLGATLLDIGGGGRRDSTPAARARLLASDSGRCIGRVPRRSRRGGAAARPRQPRSLPARQLPRGCLGLPAVEVVTLDRVVCCDPDYEAMLTQAATHARRLVAFTYPRPRWIVRAVVAAANASRRIAGRAFRAYVHSPAAMAAILERHGLHRRSSGGTFIWAAEVFER